MIARDGISTETLQRVADEMGVQLVGDQRNFVLRPLAGHEEWRKLSRGRRVNAVTWDAHYVFMEKVLRQHPNGRITSCLADYRGLTDFYRKADSTRTPWATGS